MSVAADPRLSLLLMQLRATAVRSLAVLLLGEAPWDSGAELGRGVLAGPRVVDRLLALDRHPAALNDWLSARRTDRLGAYAESLLAFWLAQQPPGVELLAANLAVRADARTVGEFDFLLRVHGQPLHVEMACKFYLEAAPGCWVGSDLRDAMAIKHARMASQLALVRDARAQATLPPGFAGCPSRTLLRGQLFRSAVDPEEGSNWWRRTGDAWPARVADSRYLLLRRLEWLPPACDNGENVSTAAALRERLTGRGKAAMVAEMQEAGDGRWREVSRGFVVPSHWPDSDRLAALKARISALSSGGGEPGRR